MNAKDPHARPDDPIGQDEEENDVVPVPRIGRPTVADWGTQRPPTGPQGPGAEAVPVPVPGPAAPPSEPPRPASPSESLRPAAAGPVEGTPDRTRYRPTVRVRTDEPAAPAASDEPPPPAFDEAPRPERDGTAEAPMPEAPRPDRPEAEAGSGPRAHAELVQRPARVFEPAPPPDVASGAPAEAPRESPPPTLPPTPPPGEYDRARSAARPEPELPPAPPPRPEAPPVRDTDGLSLDRLDVPVDDATRLAQSLRTAQRLYNESRRRFHDFVLAASDWVWEADEHGRITFISDRITEVLGKPARNLIGTSIYELGADVVEGRSLRDTLAERRPFRGLAIEIVGTEGRHRFCRVSGIPAFDHRSGHFTGYRGAGTDCTAQFEAEAAVMRSQAKLERMVEEIRTKNERLEVALKEAEAAVHAKSEFLANVSHELRTPLNAIIGFTEIMEREMYGPLGHDRYKDYAENVLQSGRHLLAIINDLLDMAKVEAGKLDLNERTIEVGGLVESCLSLMRDRIKQQGLELVLRLPSGGPLLWADERLVKQMLINLLANAVKFTPEGGTITLKGEVTPLRGYDLSVADTGIGIAEDDLATVLAPFGQVESAMNRSHAGTGLGLPLVNAMIRLHGGTLKLESTVGHGTIASLAFPPERVIDQPANA